MASNIDMQTHAVHYLIFCDYLCSHVYQDWVAFHVSSTSRKRLLPKCFSCGQSSSERTCPVLESIIVRRKRVGAQNSNAICASSVRQSDSAGVTMCLFQLLPFSVNLIPAMLSHIVRVFTVMLRQTVRVRPLVNSVMPSQTVREFKSKVSSSWIGGRRSQ